MIIMIVMMTIVNKERLLIEMWRKPIRILKNMRRSIVITLWERLKRDVIACFACIFYTRTLSLSVSELCFGLKEYCKKVSSIW